jgi:predicted NUDIX family NTP pyrophosphohydrolase
LTTSAGLLLFRERERERAGEGAGDGDAAIEVLLGHMGGPFWARKDEGAWSIPKGELLEGEDALTGARREFAEELGHPPPDGEVVELGEVRQRGGKRVLAFALRGDFDPATLHPGTFEMQWPPRSGRLQRFPEIDRVAWFDLQTAATKVVKGQVELLERLRGAAASA